MYKSHYENVPFEIPESWVWTTLGEISNYGQCENVNVDDIADGEWILELEDIEKDTGRVLQKLSKADRKVCGIRHKFRTDEVLYSKLRTYLNKVLVAPSPGFCTSEIIPINCLCSNSQYLCMVLRSNYYLDYTASLGYGVKMPRLGTNDALISYIPLPPLNEQNRIVNEVKKWEKVIDIIESGSNDLLASVAHIKSKILDLAISGKLVPQDSNDEPAIELLKRINPNFKPCDNSHYENLPFEIPSNWVWASHNDILEISGGAQPPKSEFSEVMKPGYIRLYQIRDYGEKPIPIYIPLSTASKTTVKGDILLARYGGSLGKVFIAEDGAYNVAMAKVILCYPEVLNQKFVYYYYLSSIYQNKLRSISRTAQAGFNSGDFEDMYFPLPPLNEQERIVDAISSIWEMIDMITAEL